MKQNKEARGENEQNLRECGDFKPPEGVVRKLWGADTFVILMAVDGFTVVHLYQPLPTCML